MLKMTSKKESKHLARENKKYKKAFIDEFKAIGGIKNYENYIKTAFGYQACISVYEFDDFINDLWLVDLKDVVYSVSKNVLIKVDIDDYDKDITRVIDKQTEENAGMMSGAKRLSIFNKNKLQAQNLNELQNDIAQFKETVKNVCIRIYVYNEDVERLRQITNRIIKQLKKNRNIESAVMIGESITDYQALMTKQDRIIVNPPTNTLARSFPFNMSSFVDKNGIYQGKTNTGGIFKVTQNEIVPPYRKSFDTLILGRKGFGKSIIMLNDMITNYLTGGKNIAFDIEGEYINFTKLNGGLVLSLDNKEFNFNVLQIIPIDDKLNFKMSYRFHRTRLKSIFKYMFVDINDKQMRLLLSYCQEMYKQYGYFDTVDWIKLRIPKLEHLYYKLDERLQVLNKTNGMQQGYLLEEMNNLMYLTSVMHEYIDPYILGEVFNTDNRIDLASNRLITFDLTSTKNYDKNISELMLYMCNSLAWNEITHNKNKPLLKTYFDEDHRFINGAIPIETMEMRNLMIRENRKYNSGMVMASQSLREYKGTAEGEIADRIQSMFEETTYRILLNQDDSVLPLVRKTFPSIPKSYIDKLSGFEEGQAIFDIKSVGSYQMKFEFLPQEIQLYEYFFTDKMKGQTV